MWQIIPSLDTLVQGMAPVFCEPSFQTHLQILLGWIMCLGQRTEYRVFQTIDPSLGSDHSQRHPFDRFYNFFSRSAWSVGTLAYHLVVAIVVALNPLGKLFLIVDDTLLHKRGVHVFGLGWFRDAVASTTKRVATASGNNWVVVGLVIPIPFCPDQVLCLTLLARLHHAGKGQPSTVDLAAAMLGEILRWFPERQLVLLGDGAYAGAGLLKQLDPRVTYVGRLRCDAELYDPQPLPQPPSKRGRKPQKGPRLPSPRDAVKRADANPSGTGPWVWQPVEAMAYGVKRSLQVLSYVVVWPEVLGLRAIRIVVVRDPEGKMKDCYLFTTDVSAKVAWLISRFSWRWSIEVLFKASKQVLEIEAPRHWCQQSIEKLAPWVWLLQSLITLWYLTAGHDLAQAEAARQEMGAWDSEWSLGHMLRVLRRAIMDATISPDSARKGDLQEFLDKVKIYLDYAASAA